jgi:hypothetical protein
VGAVVKSKTLLNKNLKEGIEMKQEFFRTKILSKDFRSILVPF